MKTLKHLLLHDRLALASAAMIVALVYGVLFVIVGGQVDVPFLYSNPGR